MFQTKFVVSSLAQTSWPDQSQLSWLCFLTWWGRECFQAKYEKGQFYYNLLNLATDLHVQVYYALSMDVAHSFQDLFGKNTASLFTEYKFLLNNSVEQFTSSNAADMTVTHYTATHYTLLFCYETHLILPIVISRVQLQKWGASQAVMHLNLLRYIPPEIMVQHLLFLTVCHSTHLSSLLLQVTNLAANISPLSLFLHFITRPNLPLHKI